MTNGNRTINDLCCLLYRLINHARSKNKLMGGAFDSLLITNVHERASNEFLEAVANSQNLAYQEIPTRFFHENDNVSIQARLREISHSPVLLHITGFDSTLSKKNLGAYNSLLLEGRFGQPDDPSGFMAEGSVIVLTGNLRESEVSQIDLHALNRIHRFFHAPDHLQFDVNAWRHQMENEEDE